MQAQACVSAGQAPRHPGWPSCDLCLKAAAPEQIAGPCGDRRTRARSHETIYRLSIVPRGISCLYQDLPRPRADGRPATSAAARVLIPAGTHRAASAGDPARTSSSLDGDLICSAWNWSVQPDLACGASEPLHILTRNRDRNSAGVMSGMIEKLQALPASARQSITFDRGTEFSSYRLLKHKLGIDSYFCKPQAPWQKGTVENTNGRVRRFLSRDADIAVLSEETLIDICERLNETPRKCLGYRTPAEVLMNALDPGLPQRSNPDQRTPGKPWVRGYP